MNFTQALAYCEKLIAPYKEQISDEALFEIYDFIVEYWHGETEMVYSAEELEEVEDRQGFELLDIIYWIMHEDGIPIYDNDITDDV